MQGPHGHTSEIRCITFYCSHCARLVKFSFLDLVLYFEVQTELYHVILESILPY